MQPASDEIDADEDSLFGSPPPSPDRGRSPAPLAFPSGPSSAQNVGTLALPGSHLVSELPVNPLALPSPLQPSPTLPAPYPLYAPPPSLRRPSVAPSCRPTPAPRPSRKKSKEKAPTPRATPPPIPLPDPDEPPPPNFLRNQQALLGHAGLISGVRPAHLSVRRHTRGSSPRNPIVVEDIHDPPPLGTRPVFPAVDPAQLPRPSSGQILGSLARQKDVFPVVESILRLVANNEAARFGLPPHPPLPPANTGWKHNSASTPEPPQKKRKLVSVPAGAADWDVPYPFAPGQGPEDYRKNWENERGKQLLADLISLVRCATKKAQAKLYVQQMGQNNNVRNHYRPTTLLYGIDTTAAPPVASSSTAPTTSSHASQGNATVGPVVMPSQPQLVPPQQVPPQPLPSQSSHPPSSQPQSSQPEPSTFDHLVASLMTASNESQPGAPAPSTNSAHPEDVSPDFNKWLALLQAFPPGDPSDGPTFDPNDDIFAQALSQLENEASQPEAVSSPSQNEQDANISRVTLVPDSLIDPALLAISHPAPPQQQPFPYSMSQPYAASQSYSLAALHSLAQAGTSSGTFSNVSGAFSRGAGTDSGASTPGANSHIYNHGAGSFNPSLSAYSPGLSVYNPVVPPPLIGSPLASASSFEGPHTPESIGAEHEGIDAAGVAGEPHGVAMGDIATTVGLTGELGAMTVGELGAAMARELGRARMAGTAGKSNTKPKAKSRSKPNAMRTASTTVPSKGKERASVPSAPSACVSASARAAAVRRAAEVRADLAAEIGRARVELWETTIEMGVLTHLARDGALGGR